MKTTKDNLKGPKSPFRKKSQLLMGAIFITLMGACANEEQSKTIEIQGTWYSEDDSTKSQPEVITETSWNKKNRIGTDPKSEYPLSLNSADNTTNKAIRSGKQLNYDSWPTINVQTNTVFDRVQWYQSDANTFFLCTEVFNKASMDEVRADTTNHTFDPANEDANNCGAGAWTKYTRAQ
ncbi:MAG: hypothetical protein KDK41_13495 [Leptospiraceae bacterium]|nr:hypothetical protein [Leptospiraceae bacterium]